MLPDLRASRAPAPSRSTSRRAAVASAPWSRRLSGAAKFEFTDGAIRGINIAKTLRSLAPESLSGWQENAAEKTDFATLGASFKIAKGQAETPDLRLAGPLVRMTGAGSVDLPAQTLKFRVDPQLVASLEGQGGKADLQGLGVPVVISGPWASPSIYPDIEGILKDPVAAYEQLNRLRRRLGVAAGRCGRRKRLGDRRSHREREARPRCAPERRGHRHWSIARRSAAGGSGAATGRMPNSSPRAKRPSPRRRRARSVRPPAPIPLARPRPWPTRRCRASSVTNARDQPGNERFVCVRRLELGPVAAHMRFARLAHGLRYPPEFSPLALSSAATPECPAAHRFALSARRSVRRHRCHPAALGQFVGWGRSSALRAPLGMARIRSESKLSTATRSAAGPRSIASSASTRRNRGKARNVRANAPWRQRPENAFTRWLPAASSTSGASLAPVPAARKEPGSATTAGFAAHSKSADRMWGQS